MPFNEHFSKPFEPVFMTCSVLILSVLLSDLLRATCVASRLLLNEVNVQKYLFKGDMIQSLIRQTLLSVLLSSVLS